MAADGDRIRRIAGWSLAALTLALYLSVPLSLSGGVLSRPGIASTGSGPRMWVGPIVAALALSGAALIHLRPRNVIGWILIVSGLLQVTNVAADAYSARALTDPAHSLPLGLACAWLASWTWMPSLLLPVLVLPALYPTGHAPSRYWRWHVRLSLLAIGLGVLLIGFTPDGMDDTVTGTRLPWEAPVWAAYVVGIPALVLLIVTAVNVIVGTLVRAVRARTPERQQLLWLLSVVALMTATVMTEYDIAFGLAYGLVPVAVAIGVLRYRLLGIELVLRRTLLYVPMTLLVALVIGGLTTVLARLVPEGPLPLLAASAVVAVLVLPVARRLRTLVDRLVLGAPADPMVLVDRVAADLEVEHDDPVTSMLEAVASAVGASHAAVRTVDGELVAQVGEPSSATQQQRFPLRHGGAPLGELEIGVAEGEHVTESGLRLATALAPHLAVVVHARRLTEELARERNRVTTATLAERDRLRRDLHDGLGPSLSGIALGIEAAAVAHVSDPASVPALLARTRAEAEAAVFEIRRVIDGLRPASLDVRGLTGAVTDTASMLGLGRPGTIAFALEVDPLPVLSPRVEEAAFRIVAESLTNVVRHAAASRCSVQLARSNGDLRVLVTDDGRGPRAGDGPGHGLESMRRRATDLGGSLSIDAAAPTGTVVTAVLPLEAS
jgi:signal transduction histidine kinase